MGRARRSAPTTTTTEPLMKVTMGLSPPAALEFRLCVGNTVSVRWADRCDGRAEHRRDLDDVRAVRTLLGAVAVELGGIPVHGQRSPAVVRHGRWQPQDRRLGEDDVVVVIELV